MTTEVVTVEQLLNLGFQESNDPIFPFIKPLIDYELSNIDDVEETEFCIGFGGRGMINGEGFYLMAGASLMKLGFDNISDVLIWAQHLISLEEYL